jgi:N-acetylneuraminate synthase
MMNSPVDKDAMATELAPMRALFQKSVALRRPLKRGTILSKEDLTAKKPGTGVPANRAAEFVGRRLLRDVREDELLSWDDAEPAEATR